MRCLGDPEVRLGGAPVPAERWASPQAQLVLAYLAQRGSASRDELIELVWPDGDPLKTRLEHQNRRGEAVRCGATGNWRTNSEKISAPSRRPPPVGWPSS